MRYSVKSDSFPGVTCRKGEQLPRLSLARRIIAGGTTGFSTFAETNPLAWTSRSNFALFEQTRVAGNGHAVTLLWSDVPESKADEDGGLTELGMPKFR